MGLAKPRSQSLPGCKFAIHVAVQREIDPREVSEPAQMRSGGDGLCVDYEVLELLRATVLGFDLLANGSLAIPIIQTGGTPTRAGVSKPGP